MHLQNACFASGWLSHAMASVLALSVPPPNRLIVPFVTPNLEMLQRPLESTAIHLSYP
jgi:hypothetical protein